jgi:hypothetical protein
VLYRINNQQPEEKLGGGRDGEWGYIVLAQQILRSFEWTWITGTPGVMTWGALDETTEDQRLAYCGCPSSRGWIGQNVGHRPGDGAV